MSIYVIREVFEHSRAEHGERLVLIALADGASKDEAVTWVDQRTLMELTLLSEKAVRDSLRALEELVEVETRIARKPGRRARFNCYRVLVGLYADVEVDPENLPLILYGPPFSRPADIAARRAARLDALAAAGVAAQPAARPAESAARHGVDDRQSAAATTGSFSPSRPAESAAPSRAHGSLLDPSEDPKGTQQQTGGAVVDAAAAGLELHLRRLRVAPAAIAAALADRQRAQAWLDLARRAATDNPAGFFVTGFDTGEWPSSRGSQDVTDERRDDYRRRVIHALIRNLGPVDGADEARYCIDHDWDALTAIKRAEWQALVDDLVSDQLPDATADTRERGAA